jgi:hypothetical protein
MGSQVCVMAANVGAYLSGASVTGIFAFRYLAQGVLGLIGQLTPASTSKLAFRVGEDWPQAGQTFLVDGWLGADGLLVDCLSAPVAGDVLDPNGEDCPYDDWLSDASTAPGIQADHEYHPPSPPPSYDPLSLRGNARHVEAGGMRLIDSIDPAAPVFGVYVARADTDACPYPSAADTSGCATWRVLARVTDAPKPLPSAATPSPTPTTAPPATPVVLPTGATGAAPIGLMGSGNRPLTEGEFATLWAADPAHLAGRIAIVKGPVPTGFECWSAGAADASAPPGTCHIAILDGQIAADGHYWAVRVGADGKLAIVGELSTPTSSFVFSLDGVNSATSLKDGNLVVVDGWLLEGLLTCNSGATPLPGSCLYSAIESTSSFNSPAWIGVQRGAYQEITGTAADWTTEGPPVHGLFLVRVSNNGEGTLLARLEAATP